MCFALFFTLNCMNIFVKSSHFGTFIVFSTFFYIFLHFTTRNRVYNANKSPATGKYSCSGVAVKYGIQLSQISIPKHKLLSR